MQAEEALSKIKVEYEPLEAVTDPREAASRGSFLVPPRTFSMGNTEDAWKECVYIVEGTAESGGQEHLYLETQGAYAIPMENRSVKIFSSTQGPTLVQKLTAKVLGLPMNKVEVDVARLGGGFGGKEDQATAFAAMAAMAAMKTGKPVKLILPRHTDIRTTGKRHPYSSDYRLGLNKELKIIAWEATLYQNGGAAADLSPAIQERTLFHSTGSYFIPNTSVTVFSCRTNLPPNTAFRGFGAPQGMFLIESAIDKAARKIKVPASIIQEKNLLRENDIFQYGQVAKNVNIGKCLSLAKEKFNVDNLKKEILLFNEKNIFKKKGMAMMPICFGISFTKTPMNQARALVHIYQDGSIGISTGAIEMGQGVNTKLVQVASKIFSVNPSRIRIETTNTTRVANTSPTAASSGADLNGNALRIACDRLLTRLSECAGRVHDCSPSEISIKDESVLIAGKNSGMGWEKLVETAFLERVCLTENGHYATPFIHFDKSVEKGHPFAYHVYGVAIITATVDCIRGTYTIDSAGIVHDFGTSLNSNIDIGQVEGGFMQGIGWMTMEEVAYNHSGLLLSDSLSKYKVPDIYSAPASVKVIPLGAEGPELAILRSKAVGEPPLMYGIAAYFAVNDAVSAFNPSFVPDYNAPFTPEKVLMSLYGKKL